MPDERQESSRAGIAPGESRIGRRAERDREHKLAKAPPVAESAMGGTSDAGTAADDAIEDALRSGAKK